MASHTVESPHEDPEQFLCVRRTCLGRFGQ